LRKEEITNMKKFLSLALALCLCLSLGVTAMAAEITVDGAQSATTTVTYGLESGYTVVIPESVVLATDTHKGTATIEASDVLLAYGETLKVTVTGIDKLVDASDAENTLSYKVGTTDGAEDVVNGTVVLSVAAGTVAGGEQDLYFELTQDVTKAGAYSDTLTFTVTVE
jgi:spermidine/putrescine-binding protein